MHRGKCRRHVCWIVCRQNFDYELRYAVARLSRRWTYGRRVVMAFNAGRFEGRGQRYGEERHKSEATTEHWLRGSSHMRLHSVPAQSQCHSEPSTRRQCHNAIANGNAMAMQSLHSRFVACQSRQPNQLQSATALRLAEPLELLSDLAANGQPADWRHLFCCLSPTMHACCSCYCRFPTNFLYRSHWSTLTEDSITCDGQWQKRSCPTCSYPRLAVWRRNCRWATVPDKSAYLSMLQSFEAHTFHSRIAYDIRRFKNQLKAPLSAKP